jgi:hypothetical protein
VFVSRWDTAPESTGKPDELHDGLGIAMATRTYAVYRRLLESHVRRFLPADSRGADSVVARFAASRVDVGALAARLQAEAAEAFVRSWDELLENIHQKSAALAAAA